MERIDEFLVYRRPEHGWILEDMMELLQISPGDGRPPEARRKLYGAVGGIVCLAERYGISGNLWQGFLCYLLASHENPFSTACEMTGQASGGIRRMALEDCRLFRRLMAEDMAALDEKVGCRCARFLLGYEGTKAKGDAWVGRRVESLREALLKTGGSQEFLGALSEHYKAYGVGELGLHRAFKLDENGSIRPVLSTSDIRLGDLVGYQRQKRELVKNTEDFLKGKRANNVLLYGDSGTGKSSSIQAILNEYWDRGLRMIELYKHQFRQLTEVLRQIKGRGYKFILYLDDLSFEEFETDYKYLKAIIEGGLEAKPENVLLYATSNRRHLVREQYSDRQDLDDDLHRSETMQEKLSLASRFGLSIFYVRPGREEYDAIVKALANRQGLTIPRERLLEEAARWELRNGGMSGRTAQQFINYLLGESASPIL